MAGLTPKELTSLQSQVRKAYEILVEELNNHSIDFATAEAFVFPDIKTTGVRGDHRVYEYPLMVAVYGADGKLVPPNYEFLEKIGTRIPNKINGIVRVIYRLN